MAKENYGIEKAELSLPPINLLRVPHKGKILFVNYPAFGPDSYSNNLAKIQKNYSHSKELPKISFKEPTTSESISAATYDFKNLAKPKIFDPSWLQIGRIVRTSEGVFSNPPKDKQGNPIIDEKILKKFLNKAKKVNGIYLCENDFGFAPYETFKTGIQDSGDFAERGLARLLEHTKEKTAENLRVISSSKFYRNGVNVWGFSEVKKPILKVASLGSGGLFDDGRLDVDGYDWGGDDDGCAFGVLE